MNYTPKSIKRTFKKCINEISLHPEAYAKNPGRDFTRTRKLTFKQTVKTILSMTGKSLRGELMDYFKTDVSAPRFLHSFNRETRSATVHLRLFFTISQTP